MVEELISVLSESIWNLFQCREQFIENLLELKVPNEVFPDSFTCHKHFHVTHYVDVELHIKRSLNMKVRLPITIYPSRHYPKLLTMEKTLFTLVTEFLLDPMKTNSILELFCAIIHRYADVAFVSSIFSKVFSSSLLSFLFLYSQNSTVDQTGF